MIKDPRLIFFFGFGVWGFFWGFCCLRRRRLIENIPTSTVRGLAMGLVELIGKAENPAQIRSPFADAICAFYSYTVERMEGTGKSRHWVTISKGDSTYFPFYLNDGTGRVLVTPEGAEVILPVNFEFATGWGKNFPDNLKMFMEKNNLKYKGFLGDYELRFKEWIIVEEENVYVLGSAKICNDPVMERKRIMFKRFEELENNPQKLKEVDENKDGQISPDEWKAAVERIEKEALGDIIAIDEAQTPFSELNNVAVGKGDVEKTFIISNYSQKDLKGKLFWQSLLGIYGGAALALAILWVFLFG